MFALVVFDLVFHYTTPIEIGWEERIRKLPILYQMRRKPLSQSINTVVIMVTVIPLMTVDKDRRDAVLQAATERRGDQLPRQISSSVFDVQRHDDDQHNATVVLVAKRVAVVSRR